MPRNINVDAPPDPHVILGIARNAGEADDSRVTQRSRCTRALLNACV